MSLALVGVSGLLWAALLWELVFIVPRFERQFAEFAVRVPGTTAAVMDVSRWVGRYWYVLILGAIPAAWAAVVLTQHVRRGRAGRWLGAAWFLLLLALPVLAHVLVWWSILVPYSALVEGLGGGKGP